MAEEIAIKVEGINKTFKLPHEKQTSIKNVFVNVFNNKRTYEKQHVLNDISFEIKKGEFFGIVGRNGSGKSTLLKLLAGIYTPNSGSIHIEGKLTPFIELGVGFSPELTGRENVFLNGALLGFNRKEMEAMYEEIVAFAELEKFMDQKLKNYSSGMQVRLAFSIAIRAKSDILLIDEVLAVGDAIFQRKCYNFFKELKKIKKTVVFVSHDMSALQEYCDRGVLIDSGNLVKKDYINAVVKEYTNLLSNAEVVEAENGRTDAQNGSTRWGTGDIKITNSKITGLSRTGGIPLITEDNKTLNIEVSFEAFRDNDSPTYGITIFDAAGECIFQSNTLWLNKTTQPLTTGHKTTVKWEVPNIFNTGDFSVSPAVADKMGNTIFDWLDQAIRFRVRKELRTSAFVNVDHSITISKPTNATDGEKT